MTKHNEAYPDAPGAALRSAISEAFQLLREAESVDEFPAISNMVHATADEAGPGPHQILLRLYHRYEQTRAQALMRAQASLWTEGDTADG